LEFNPGHGKQGTDGCGDAVLRMPFNSLSNSMILRYVAGDPMLTRILKVLTLPVQSTYWRFLDSLHGGVAP
jgi:hypothetical protein